ncbi:MAG: hypothetical protein J1E05_04055 [Eubacterium sp.]|nr:hypothetical protein [Eubacterium sp.]
MAEKKKWSKGQKIAVIVSAVIAFLLAVAIIGGVAVLNWYCKPKEFNVISVAEVTSADVTLIAHRGFSAVAPENTAPAFEEAGLAGFGAAECDIYRTKDGVWVISHDINTYRMMDKSGFVESLTLEKLMSFNYDNGSNIENYPNLKVCTLDEYLEICAKYDMVPVIELKGKNNTEHYDEVVASVEKYGLTDKVVYISFHLVNLQKLRALSDATLYYLVHTIDEQSIEDALSLGGRCGIDFNGNKEANTKEIIQQCIDKGLLMGAWTIDSPEACNRMLDCGVSLITTNAIRP